MSKAAHRRAKEILDERATSETASAKQPTAEEIRMRAYHIYQERGGVEGYDLEDWLQAERELQHE